MIISGNYMFPSIGRNMVKKLQKHMYKFKYMALGCMMVQKLFMYTHVLVAVFYWLDNIRKPIMARLLILGYMARSR